MPTIAYFFGIQIIMWPNDHNTPHLHAIYSGMKAKYSLLSGKLVKGYLPSKQDKMVMDFIEKYKNELLAMWNSSIYEKIDDKNNQGVEFMKYNSYNLVMGRKVEFIKEDPIHIWFKEGTTFDVLFADGLIKRYDMMNASSNYPLYKRLQDRNLFLKAKPFCFGIIWDEEVDIASEYIYDNGQDVTDEYTGYENYLVGYQLKRKRLYTDITQEQLAQKTGIDQATIAKIENGSMNPSVKTIMRIVRALNGKVELKIK